MNTARLRSDIKMVDLHSQYSKIKEEIDISIQKVIDSTSFINGDQVRELQYGLEKYLGVKHVIPCANGTDALQIAIMSLDLSPGDEIITTNFTFAATVEVIALLGLKPILVDVCTETFNIDISKIEAVISSKTKAIIPVHLFGQCVDMDPLLKIAKRHNLKIIEDTAQAIGAEYRFSDKKIKKAGTIGDIGTTSFFPSKNLGCFGDGGAIFTDNDALAGKIRAIVNHGMIKRYYHDMLGVNSRLDSIQAAILNVKLKYLDSYNKARNKAATFYNQAFRDVEEFVTPYIADFSSHVFHQYTLQLTNGIDRESLREFLSTKNIPSMIYYPVPLHQQKAYASKEFKDSDYPVTIFLSKNVLSLPMHSELSDNQLDYIVKAVLEFLNL